MNLAILKKAIEFSIVKKQNILEYKTFIDKLLTELNQKVLIINVLSDKNQLHYLLIDGNTIVIQFDDNMCFIDLQLIELDVVLPNNDIIDELNNYISEQLELMVLEDEDDSYYNGIKYCLKCCQNRIEYLTTNK